LTKESIVDVKKKERAITPLKQTKLNQSKKRIRAMTVSLLCIPNKAANGSVSNRFCWFGLQLVHHWFGLNRLALENGLVQFGLPVRMVWTGLD